VRANISYFYQNTYGIAFGIQNTAGSADPLLYAADPVDGSANYDGSGRSAGANNTLYAFAWLAF
jgi:hypothetical protein